MKRKERVAAAQSKVAVAGLLAQTATDKIVPLAQSASTSIAPLAQAAAGRVAPLAGQAVTFAAPYAQQAREAVTPYAQQAADAVTPYAQTVVDKVGPYAEIAAGRVAPLAAAGALAAHEAVDKLGPAVEAARDKVTEDVLPKISTALTAAAASPVAVEASRRGRAAYAAARGELSLPEVEAQKRGSWVRRIAVVAAVAGLVALVARRFLGGSKESGWQAARPSAPYAPATPPSSTTAPSTTPPSTADANAAAVATEDLSSAGSVDEATLETVETTPDVSTTAPDPMPGPDNPTPYGPGSYVGSEPPEGYTIKGNENSMKFHLPGGRGFDQTAAEVWFDSEDAAERAGFTRAKS